MPRIRRITVVVAVAVAVVVSVLAAGPRIAASASDFYTRVEVLTRMLEIIETHYVEEVGSDQLFENAIDGVLKELDPHSRYYSAEEYRQLTERYRGDYHGIGIQFDILDGYITVIDVLEGGPSEALGLRPGDQIVAINGEDAHGIVLEETYEKLRGPRGTQVDVTVRRPGQDERLDFTITRDQVEIAAIRAKAMLDPTTGYIWLQTFSQKTADQLEDSLRDLESQGMETLVLDLRGNSGGLMNQAIQVTDKFITGGKVIVQTKGRTPNSNSESLSSDRPTHPRIPLIVLVDHRSASASEIVAGALQDWDRGLVVGQRTFGKALVQNQFPFKDGSALFLTIARYYTPSGRLIQRPYEDRSDYHDPDWDQLGSFAEAEDDGPGEGEEGASADLTPAGKAGEESEAPAATFTTAGGRTVRGGGGIAPDVQVESTQVSNLALRLFQRRLYFQFATDYVARNRESIPADFDEFRTDYRVADELLDDFLAYLREPSVRSLLQQDEVKLKEEELEEAREDIRVYLKSDIAASIWGQEQAWITLLDHDDQVQKALVLTEQAADLLELGEQRLAS